jgi:hypothetical protein
VGARGGAMVVVESVGLLGVEVGESVGLVGVEVGAGVVFGGT